MTHYESETSYSVIPHYVQVPQYMNYYMMLLNFCIKKFLYFQVMLDTGGPEVRVCNRTGRRIELKADNHITFTPDVTKEPTSEVLPVNYQGLAAVCFAYAFTISLKSS